MKEILNKLKENKKLLISFVLIISLVLLCIGISFSVFNYSSDNAGNNDINSGHISMTYTEPSNEYIVENALPMKDVEGMNSTNYFEFSVTTTAPTNDTDNEGISIPYEVTITETEGNTLTNDKIKMYLTEVEGENENAHTNPTLASLFEPSLYKNEGIKIGFNLHLHRNGNETITTKYRLRAWIDENVDVSDWDTAGEFGYKFKVNVNGEAAYQGYKTDQSCFAYEVIPDSRYVRITGYDFNRCDSKNVVVPELIKVPKEGLFKEIKSVVYLSDYEFSELSKNNLIKDGFCDDYGAINTEDDWQNCVTNIFGSVEIYEKTLINEYIRLKKSINLIVGGNYYDYETEIEEYESLGVAKFSLGEEETNKKYFTLHRVYEIKSFLNTSVTPISDKSNISTTNDLNNVIENKNTNIKSVADETYRINSLLIPENINSITIENENLKIDMLIDKTGNFPGACFRKFKDSNRGGWLIDNYSCSSVKNVRIPSMIGDYPVIELNSTFGHSYIETVVIPNTVIEISGLAFYKNNLTEINIPDSVTTLGGGVFSYNKIKKVKFSKNITELPEDVLKYNELTEIEIPENITSIGRNAFAHNKLEKVVISDSVTNIEPYAFEENNINDLKLGSSVITIGEYAFQYNNLKEVTIPSSVTSIGQYAFFKSSFSNLGLEKIINETEKELPWCLIVSGTNIGFSGPDSFASGTIKTYYGNVEVVLK